MKPYPLLEYKKIKTLNRNTTLFYIIKKSYMKRGKVKKAKKKI